MGKLKKIIKKGVPLSLKTVLTGYILAILVGLYSLIATGNGPAELIIGCIYSIFLIVGIIFILKQVYILLLIIGVIPAWIYFVLSIINYGYNGREVLPSVFIGFMGIIAAFCLTTISAYRYFFGAGKYPPWNDRYWKKGKKSKGKR